MSEPQIPIYGWSVFELIEEPNLLRACHPSEPHWVPRGGTVGAEVPDLDYVKHSALQSSGRLVVVRHRLEIETRVDVPFELDSEPAKRAEQSQPTNEEPVQRSLFQEVR